MCGNQCTYPYIIGIYVSPQMRDLRQVYDKLRVVLMPLGEQQTIVQKLRECKSSAVICVEQ
jgi:hypothetical protein